MYKRQPNIKVDKYSSYDELPEETIAMERFRRNLTGTEFDENNNTSLFYSEIVRQGYIDYEVSELCSIWFRHKKSGASIRSYSNFNWDDFDISFKGLHPNLVLEVSDRNDIFSGSIEADEISGQIGNDRLFGNQGNDILNGGAGNDQLWGGDDSDVLMGGSDNDMLSGCKGEDNLHGGEGKDRLVGGAADDIMAGGSGPDTFIFRAGYGDDVITDFDPEEDILEFGVLHYDTKNLIMSLAHQQGDNVIFDLTKATALKIDYSTAGSLTLHNIQLSDLSDEHIIIMPTTPRFSSERKARPPYTKYYPPSWPDR